MDAFIKRALFLSGLALALHCQPLARASDIMVWQWNKAYEYKLQLENEENFRRESMEAVIIEAKEEPPTIKMETQVIEPETQPETTIQNTLSEPESVPEPVTEATSEVPTEETTAAPVVQETPLYSVNGHTLSTEIQVYLYNALAVRGIGWFYPYAMLIAYQESNFNIYAENPNGLDKGLFQYRIIYVPWMDWTNPYVQIDYFSEQMKNRAYAGCAVAEMISRHNTSDYGSYNQDYVNHVMQWESVMIKIN